jgi:hypothetical protein
MPGLGYCPALQAVTYFDRRLWVIVQDSNGNLVQATMTLELNNDKTIDLQGGATAWTIMFVVTAYESNDGTPPYTYPGQ